MGFWNGGGDYVYGPEDFEGENDFEGDVEYDDEDEFHALATDADRIARFSVPNNPPIEDDPDGTEWATLRGEN